MVLKFLKRVHVNIFVWLLVTGFITLVTLSTECHSKEYTNSSLEYLKPKHHLRFLCLQNDESFPGAVRNLGILCDCPLVNAPVCGSDNITYKNRCFMHCLAHHPKSKYNRYRVRLKKYGPC